MTRLTEGLLIKLGFRGEGKDCTNNPAYRLKVPKNEYGHYFSYQIQVVLGPYPDSNPNSGILSMYRPPVKDAHMLVQNDEDIQADYVQWDLEDAGNGEPGKGGIKYIDIPEICHSVAHYVTTLERLNEIYVALTMNKPLTVTEL